MISLSSSIKSISRVGESTAKRLLKLDIETVQDLLLHFPFRYDDFSRVTPIAKLIANTSANIVGTIDIIENKRSPRKRMHITEALVSDESEQLRVIWFNQPYLSKTLKNGDRVSLSGRVENDYLGLVMNSPNHEKMGSQGAVHTQGLVPNYPLTAGVTQKQIRYLIKQILPKANDFADWLPDQIQKELGLVGLGKAIHLIHFPKNLSDIDSAKKRLAFNEIFLLQIQAQIARMQKKSATAQAIPFLEEATKEFTASLPFKLTDGQKKSAWQIINDIGLDSPMTRLLEGDVGSGKTVVAAIAMLNTALNEKSPAQSALMAPTEILARQHFESLKKLFAKTPVKLGLFTRSEQKIYSPVDNEEKKLSKKKMTEALKNGEANIIIGTHALVQEAIEFKNLALAIIDEQHRFGVEQRLELMKKSGNPTTTPHLLSMTATPIPRSLAMALFGDLDVSIISELPKNRKPILTRIVKEDKRLDAYKFIKQEIEKGRQAFFICPLIDESDKLGVKSVKEVFQKLNEEIFPDIQMDMLHGRLKAKEKEEIMQKFLDDKTKILVSTSIVEVGVDIPNASLMAIEDAERFGLAQLHQFRGRVGRDEHQSYCLLFTETDNPDSIKRLDALVKSSDGFKLAQMDLQMRGPGEVFGTAQKGFPDLKVANLFDHLLIKNAQVHALKLLEEDPDLDRHLLLKHKISRLETENYLA